MYVTEKGNKNVNVTAIMFLMSGDLTGLCLYMCPIYALIYQVGIIPVNYSAVWSSSAVQFAVWSKIFGLPVFIYWFIRIWPYG